MREKSNGDFTGHDSIFHIAATAKQRRQRRRWSAAPCGYSFVGINDAAAGRQSQEQACLDAAAATDGSVAVWDAGGQDG